ncbi:hypothetical protein [Serratia marcescens]|uniref:hypothetical protein n=1 Tax=Serratia marcescens TaxID=615 RepID=UPI000ADC04D0|nr:hypothetical protein [Serratia marcescens]
MKGLNTHLVFLFKNVIFIFIALLVFGANSAQAKGWYQGGTLHEANALTWQKATQQDKLATCADFIAGLYSKDLLAPEISEKMKSVDDFKPYASELVKQLDAAFAPESDPAQNKKMFTNQTVKSTAMMLMIMMKWVQN